MLLEKIKKIFMRKNTFLIILLILIILFILIIKVLLSKYKIYEYEYRNLASVQESYDINIYLDGTIEYIDNITDKVKTKYISPINLIKLVVYSYKIDDSSETTSFNWMDAPYSHTSIYSMRLNKWIILGDEYTTRK